MKLDKLGKKQKKMLDNLEASAARTTSRLTDRVKRFSEHRKKTADELIEVKKKAKQQVQQLRDEKEKEVERVVKSQEAKYSQITKEHKKELTQMASKKFNFERAQSKEIVNLQNKVRSVELESSKTTQDLVEKLEMKIANLE